MRRVGTKLKTVSVRLDDQADARLERVARLLRQSKGAFLARAGNEAAEQVLLDWAAQRHRAGEASLSELAEETKLPLEAIAMYISRQGAEEALEMYLNSAKTLSDTFGTPNLYAKAQDAVRLVREEDGRG